MEGEQHAVRANDDARAQGEISLDDSGRVLSFVLRTGKVRVKNIRYEAGELELTVNARIDPESLKEFAAGIGGLAGLGKRTDTLNNEIASAETEVIPRHAGKEAQSSKAAEVSAAAAVKNEVMSGNPAETASAVKSAGSIPGLKHAAHIRYICPKCKTPGAQPGDKVGAIVTCRRCGKAMRLTVKR